MSYLARMTTQLIDAYYRAFNRADFAGMLALVADDVIHDVNQGEREVGRERFAKFLARMEQSHREQLIDLVIMADATQRHFAVEFIVLGTYLKADAGFPEARGQTYRLPAGAFLEAHAGRVTRITTYYNLQDWLAQVS
jgi:steroid delta-isomerase-like uncharacterized protein